MIVSREFIVCILAELEIIGHFISQRCQTTCAHREKGDFRNVEIGSCNYDLIGQTNRMDPKQYNIDEVQTMN